MSNERTRKKHLATIMPLSQKAEEPCILLIGGTDGAEEFKRITEWSGDVIYADIAVIRRLSNDIEHVNAQLVIDLSLAMPSFSAEEVSTLPCHYIQMKEILDPKTGEISKVQWEYALSQAQKYQRDWPGHAAKETLAFLRYEHPLVCEDAA